MGCALDPPEAAVGQGRGLAAGLDRRARLPDALEALLRAPVLTPKALAAPLKIAPQTTTGTTARAGGAKYHQGGDGPEAVFAI